MKSLRLLFLLALLLPVLAFACPGEECVRVGSWNIAWLGSENREQPGDPATIRAMADLIANTWSIDLVALQEINTAVDGELYGERHSTAAWQQLKAALQQHGYRVRSGDSGQVQRVVIAWRAPVKEIKAAQDLPIPESYQVDDNCRSSGLRKPLAGLYRAGGFDFWAVGLHLKSGYGKKGRCADAVREQQVYYMLKQFPRLQQQDPDILLLGDFNATSGHRSLAGLRDAGFVSLADKQRRHPDSNSYTQGRNGRGSLIDQLMVQTQHTAEWQRLSTFIPSPADPAAFAQRYSDHLPVWADFSTAQDDD